MPKYLFDTNIISDLIKNPHSPLAKRISAIASDSFCTSIIVACELRYGSAKKISTKLTERVELILNEIDIQPLTDDVSLHYGMIRTTLEQQGQIIGANDLLIAAHCLALNATLVTANYDEFSRVKKLKVENWLD